MGPRAVSVANGPAAPSRKRIRGCSGRQASAAQGSAPLAQLLVEGSHANSTLALKASAPQCHPCIVSVITLADFKCIFLGTVWTVVENQFLIPT